MSQLEEVMHGTVHINKCCKEIGAQVARAEKEKNDVATKSYRKVYMRYMTHLSRHPNDEEKRNKLKELTSGIKEWRKKCRMELRQ